MFSKKHPYNKMILQFEYPVLSFCFRYMNMYNFEMTNVIKENTSCSGNTRSSLRKKRNDYTKLRPRKLNSTSVIYRGNIILGKLQNKCMKV